MVCYNPILACFNRKDYERTGKKDIHLVMHEEKKGDPKWLVNEKYFPHANYEYIYLPCRKCIGCKSDNAKMWMTRAYNEMKLHKQNCFITLTYSDESPLVKDDPLCLATLRYKHFQNFMKRLRKEYNYPKLKYLMSGEYGSKNNRSHWHAILFNFDFPDKKLQYVSKGYRHYSSDSLNRLWSVYDRKDNIYVPIGFTDLADCDVDCCAYVSQYVLKKANDFGEKPVYVDNMMNDDGTVTPLELIDRVAPMVRSSRNPSIGLDWFKKYGSQFVELGYVPVKSGDKFINIKCPKYYNDKFEEIYPEKYSVIKKCKEEKAKQIGKPKMSDLRTWCESHLHRVKEAMNRKFDSI